MNARDFATQRHKGQYRRSGDEYITHPTRVATDVRDVKGRSKNIDDIESAAYLHDTLEDTETTYDELVDEFGRNVADIVMELTSDKEEIKRVGKTPYLRNKMAGMSSYALVVKLADRLDNVRDLAQADHGWALKYAQQTQDIIEYLIDNRELSQTHLKLINKINDKIAEAAL